jgi:hypothetical protein
VVNVSFIFITYLHKRNHSTAMNLALIRPNFRLLSFIFAVLFLLTASGLFLSLQSDPEDPISFQPRPNFLSYKKNI